METGNSDRPRLAELHRAERTELIRQEILDAALTEFTERGYQETTIAHIGQRLGSAPSMIYNYFTSKRDILEQAVEGSLTTIMTAFAEATMALPSTVDEFRTMANRLGDVAVGTQFIDPEVIAARPINAFIPFGTGPHRGIGSQLGYMNAQFILALFFQRYRMQTPHGWSPRHASTFSATIHGVLPATLERVG